MILKTVEFSLRQRALVLLGTFILAAVGIGSALRLRIDAVPDITSPQVLVNTAVPALAPEEIEKLVTFPIEAAVNGATNVRRVRSSSSAGISIVWIEFEWNTDICRL